MNSTQIIPMSERRYELIPVDQIEVLNSRNRDKTQFEENVRSIKEVGLLKPVVVNARRLEKTGKYQLICGEGRYLACRQLGRTEIPSEVIDCDDMTALLYSLVENIARVPPGSMWFAYELKRMHDGGISFAKIAEITGKQASYVSDCIQLVEQGEERLINGVMQGLFSMTFARMVAKSNDSSIQHVLMDAFDNGIVSSANIAKVRRVVELRSNRGKTPCRQKNGAATVLENYSLKELKRDIARATKEKEDFVRVASLRENRLLSLLIGLESLRRDSEFQGLLKEAALADQPALHGDYSVPREIDPPQPEEPKT